MHYYWSMTYVCSLSASLSRRETGKKKMPVCLFHLKMCTKWKIKIRPLFPLSTLTKPVWKYKYQLYLSDKIVRQNLISYILKTQRKAALKKVIQSVPIYNYQIKINSFNWSWKSKLSAWYLPSELNKYICIYPLTHHKDFNTSWNCLIP